MKIILSIHDVNPCFSNEIETITGKLSDLNYTYLVTPNWHGKYPLNKDFIAQLDSKEIVLHGVTHQGRGDILSHVIFGKGHNREFFKLNYEETKDRICQGMSTLNSFGINTSGFIPPMWHHNKYSLNVLKELGFEFTESFARLINLNTLKQIRNYPMTFDFGENKLLSLTSLAWNSFRIKVASPTLLRVAIHPADVKNGHLKRIIYIIRTAQAKGAVFCSYKEVLEL